MFKHFQQTKPCYSTIDRANGFTLIELIIVLAVAVIITSVAVPAVMGTMASNRVTTAANELVTTLNLAKSEAIRTNKYIALCKSPDAQQCDSSADWKQGWILFYNDDNDIPPVVDSGEKIIRIQAPLHGSLNFTFKAGNYIRFYPNGRTNESGHFCFRNAYDEDRSKAVVITQVGRIRTEIQSTSTCTGI